MSDAIEKPTDIEVPKSSLWTKLPVLGGVVGVIGLGATLAAAMGSPRAMYSYLWAFEFCLALALGGLGWVLISQTVRAGWSAVLARVNETVMATIPLFALLWIPIGTLGYKVLYPWTHETDEILASKRWFLSDKFFFGRAIAYFVIWILLSQIIYAISKRNDTEGSDTARRDANVKKIWAISAPGILLWALTISFAAIDWLMSLDPYWYSTIFGVYFFAGAVLAFFAFVTLVTMSLQRAGVLKEVTTEHFHDLGKYLFGFTIFWAYIGFSQFMLIWYANMPEETEFFMHRMQGGWQYLSLGLPVIHFFVPFLYLLSRHIKRSRVGLAIGAVYIIVMEALDLFWLVMPNYRVGESDTVMALAWTDIAAIVGMFGLFIAVFSFFLTRNKVVAVNDPRLTESLAHENY